MVLADEAFTKAVAEVFVNVADLSSHHEARDYLKKAVHCQEEVLKMQPLAIEMLRKLYFNVDTAISDKT